MKTSEIDDKVIAFINKHSRHSDYEYVVKQLYKLGMVSRLEGYDKNIYIMTPQFVLDQPT